MTKRLVSDGLGLGPTPNTGVQSVNCRDLLASELEVEDVDVLRDA